MHHNFRQHISLSLALVVLSLFSFVGCKKKAPYQRVEGIVFSTYYHITYQSDQNCIDTINKALYHLNEIANPFDSTSLLYAINNNHKQWSDSAFIPLFQLAEKVAASTNGYYDVTVGPLVNLWGFGYDNSNYHGIVPRQKIDSVKQFVGYKKIRIQGDTVYKEDPRISIDMASIAKGYSSDLVAINLEKMGVTNYLVEVGGEISYNGVNPEGKPWRVGVNKPTLDSTGMHDGEIEAIVQLQGKGGLATSGTYRNFKVNNKGERYAHIIDPIEGIPVQRDVVSATIVAPTCAEADALATACIVMGSEKVLPVLEQYPGVEALLLVLDKSPKGYHRVATSGMQKLLVQ